MEERREPFLVALLATLLIVSCVSNPRSVDPEAAALPASGGHPVAIGNLSHADKGAHWVSVTLPESVKWAPGTKLQAAGGITGHVGENFGVYPTAHLKLPSIQGFEFREVRLRRLVQDAPVLEATARGPPAASTALFRVLNKGKAVEPKPVIAIAPRAGIYYHRARLGMLVVETWFQLLPDNPLVPFEVLVTNSDPRVDKNEVALDLQLDTTKAIRPVIDYRDQKGFATTFDGERWTVDLTRNAIGDRQSIHVRGRLHLLGRSAADTITQAADVDGPTAAVSLGWEDGWGPWRVTPKLGRVGIEAEVFRLTVDHWNRFVSKRASVWDKGTRAKQARKTGHDHDYGPTKGVEIFAAGKFAPASLYVLGDLATAEACRPQQIYEGDGSPVQVEKRPGLQSLGFRPHYRTNHSDQLGKTNSKGLYGWEPMSFSHASNNGLVCFAILARSYASQRLLQHQITWLRANRGAGWGEIRGYGRCMQVAAWCYLATADNRLLVYFGNRWQGEFDSYLARARTTDVSPWAWTKARSDWPLWPKVSWLPWQEGIFVRGLDGLLEVHKRYRGPSPKAAETLAQLSDTVVRHGFYRLAGKWVLGYQIARMPGDRGLTSNEYADRLLASPHYGTAVDWWSIAAAPIRERIAPAEQKPKARTLREHYEASLAEMPLGFHGWAEWLAVR
jgi:hypothetical protein